MSNAFHVSKRETAAIFTRAISCSQALATVLNKALASPNELHERSIHPLAGGLLKSGHQCGMIWGATLAAGAEAARRSRTLIEGEAAAVRAAAIIEKSFREFTSHSDCRDITRSDFSKVTGKLKYILTGKAAGCVRLAANWAPKAYNSIEATLEKEHGYDAPPRPSCAAIAVKRMGGSNMEAVALAGFAGGIGLSGGGCGALAAAIFLAAMKWHRDHPDARESLLAALKQEIIPGADFNAPAIEIMKRFRETTGGKMTCRDITGKTFASIEEHSAFLETGGCAQIIEVLQLH